MKKLLTFSILALTLTGCASLPFMGPPAATAPVTPVFFQPQSTTLDAPGLSAIASAAKAANNAPTATVTVTGAADNSGAAAADLALSKARAETVANALAQDGVDASRITIHAIGSTSAPGDSNGAQAARRVLIEVAQ